MKIYSIDSGKSNTCFYNGEKSKSFPTKITMDEDCIKGLEGNTHTIIYEGVLYKLGEGANVNNLDVSKNSLIHKISILMAIGLMMEGDKVVCNVVTGTPVNLFFTSEREDIGRSLKGKHVVGIDGVVKDIVINKVLVLPETMGCVYMNLDKCKDRIVKVIDIGGLNTNGCIYENGKIVPNSYFTHNDGVNNLKSKLKNILNKGGGNYQDYEVEFILRNGFIGLKEEEVIREAIRGHLEGIKREMKAFGWNIGNGSIFFTGGGSIVMRDVIKEVFSNSIISSNGIMDNVEGFYKVGEALCRNQ